MAIAGRTAQTLEAVKSIGNGVVAVQAGVAKLEDIDRTYQAVAKKLGTICRIDTMLLSHDCTTRTWMMRAVAHPCGSRPRPPGTVHQVLSHERRSDELGAVLLSAFTAGVPGSQP